MLESETLSHSMGACFSPYMVISSALQFVFGKERREEQERSNRLNLEFQNWLSEQKEQFEDDLNNQKMQWMREKLQFQKAARAEQKYASKELNYKTNEVKLFFQKYLPIELKCLKLLNAVAKQYRKDGYSSKCPLNVILLHALQEKLDYSVINNQIDAAGSRMGNFVVQRWCRKNVAHNSAILNLHAVMENIPTLVISPFYYGEKMHFNVAMWEAQADTKPTIRPAISIDCSEDLLKTKEDKENMQKKIGYISTLLSGCARDIYMLFSFGIKPSLPNYLNDAGNRDLLEFIRKEENIDVCQFVLLEYASASDMLLNMESVDQKAMKLLADCANDALCSLSESMNRKLRLN